MATKQMIPLRPCGHPQDAMLYFGMGDGTIWVYCLPCIFNMIGAKPCEITTPEAFMRKYVPKELWSKEMKKE